MKRVLDILPPKPASYVALLAYVGASKLSFPGDWAVLTLALMLFSHFRVVCYRKANEEQKRRYFALGVGYLVFIAFSLVVMPWATVLPLGSRVLGVWLYLYLDLLYIVPATIYLIVLDRKNESLPPPVPSTTSARGAA